MKKEHNHSQFIHSEEAQQLLNERARVFAEIETESGQEQSVEQYICFRLGDKELFGVPYQYVDEIINPIEIVDVPCTPKFIAGVVNRRSEILAVIDVKYFFNMTKTNKNLNRKIWVIVVKEDDMKLGILVDEVYGNNHYIIESLAAPLVSSKVMKMEYIKGLIDGKITLLNMRQILGDSDLQINEHGN